MESESKIIKFINTIDKREIGWIDTIGFSHVHNMIPCLTIEYYPKYALKPSIISLDKSEQEVFNIFRKSDDDAIDCLLENDISIDDFKNYLLSIDNPYGKGINKISLTCFGDFLLEMNDFMLLPNTRKFYKIPMRDFLYFISKKSSNKKISTKQAVEKLCEELRDDKEYYFGWQANIAMSILDTKRWFLEEYDLEEVPKEMEHSLANKAAIHFLNSLIK